MVEARWGPQPPFQPNPSPPLDPEAPHCPWKTPLNQPNWTENGVLISISLSETPNHPTASTRGWARAPASPNPQVQTPWTPSEPIQGHFCVDERQCASHLDAHWSSIAQHTDTWGDSWASHGHCISQDPGVGGQSVMMSPPGKQRQAKGGTPGQISKMKDCFIWQRQAHHLV